MVRTMHGLILDLKFAIRVLLRNPTMTVISVFTLGLGIGATTAVFSVVDATVLTPPPFPDPGRLVRLYSTKPSAGWTRMTLSLPDFVDWREQSTSFDEMGVFEYTTYNLSGSDQTERVTAVRADAGVLRALGSTPTLGRAHYPTEDRPGGSRVVMLSDSFWHQKFGADPTVVGETVILDGVGHQVIGVLPPAVESAFQPFQLWAPFTTDPATAERSFRNSAAVARLAPGASLARAATELDGIGARLAETYPDSNSGYGVRVISLSEVLLGADSRRVLELIATTVGFVLLIACVNIANLLLAATGSREREFAVRAALGAGTARVARQVLTESALLAVVGGGFGVAMAYLAVPILTAGLEATIGPMGDLSVNRRALLFALALLGATTLGFGLPAAMRASGSHFSNLIRSGSRSVLGGRGARIRRDCVVVAQVAMALAVLISASLMTRSLAALRTVDPGFETDERLTLSVSLPDDRYPSETEQAAFFDRALEEIRALPQVRSAAAVSVIPLIGYNGNASMTFEDRPDPDPAKKVFVGALVATPYYLETMGIPLKAGNDFVGVGRGATPGIIVNQFMAETFWPGESALGKRVKYGPRDSELPWLEVVGVMGDYRQTSLDVEVRFETLVPPTLFASPTMTFVVRTHGDPAAATTDVRTAVGRADPDLAVFGIATMAEIKADNTRAQNDLVAMLAAFSLVALVLATGGLYGVISYTVSRTTHEIGVRMALGAEAQTILLAVLRRTMKLVLSGLAVGGLLAWLLSRSLGGLLFAVSATDPVTYLAVAVLMLVVGLVAGLVPALRASQDRPHGRCSGTSDSPELR